MAWLWNECWGFQALRHRRDSTVRCMHYFHGNGSFHLPISSLAESPAVLCAETAKRGDYLPHPQHGAGDSSELPMNKSLVFTNNMQSWEEGSWEERMDFLFWWETVLPPTCRSACSLPSAAQVNKQHVPFLVLPELPALICSVRALGGDMRIIRDEKFECCFHVGIPVQNKIEVDQTGWQTLLSPGSLAPRAVSNLF